MAPMECGTTGGGGDRDQSAALGWNEDVREPCWRDARWLLLMVLVFPSCRQPHALGKGEVERAPIDWPEIRYAESRVVDFGESYGRKEVDAFVVSNRSDVTATYLGDHPHWPFHRRQVLWHGDWVDDDPFRFEPCEVTQTLGPREEIEVIVYPASGRYRDAETKIAMHFQLADRGQGKWVWSRVYRRVPPPSR